MALDLMERDLSSANDVLAPLTLDELEMDGGNWADAIGLGTGGAIAGGTGWATLVDSSVLAGVELGAWGGPWGVVAGAAIGGIAGAIMGMWG